MPTARELLQQADALMRRNRGHSTQVAVPPERFVAVADMRSAADDVPMLTDAVDDIFADLGLPSVELESAVREVEKIAEETHHDPLAWLASDGTETSLHGVTGPAPDSADVVAVVSRKAVGSDATPVPEHSEVDLAHPHTIPESLAERITPASDLDAVASLPPVPQSDVTSDDEHWRSLGEQISMQVLQRIDLFTDTGLKQQLALHLQPIVERASAELVAAINDRVGQLVRTYVAEAIEREIAQWREHH